METMTYRHLPPALRTDQGFIGILIFVECHRRTFRGQFGKMDAHITEACHIEGGYCLDAPSLIPAGSCRYYKFGPESDDWLVEQRMVDRDTGEVP